MTELLIAMALLWFQTGTSKTIMVRPCGIKEYAPIFSDAARTVPMNNPFSSNADGSYRFYTTEKCVEVSAK
jgi:hypothetical protein